MRPDEDVGFVDVYDLQLRSWSANLALPDLHEPRSSAIAFAANGRIYVLGGVPKFMRMELGIRYCAFESNLPIDKNVL